MQIWLIDSNANESEFLTRHILVAVRATNVSPQGKPQGKPQKKKEHNKSKSIKTESGLK